MIKILLFYKLDISFSSITKYQTHKIIQCQTHGYMIHFKVLIDYRS